jgi:hypothetical protein
MTLRFRCGILLFAAAITTGCGGATAVSDRTSERVMTAPLAEVVGELRSLCDSTCALDATCGSEPDAVAACGAYCAERFDATARLDTPTERVCLDAERREMMCFASLTCEERAAYFEGPSDGGYRCEELDRNAIDACSR